MFTESQIQIDDWKELPSDLDKSVVTSIVEKLRTCYPIADAQLGLLTSKETL